MKLWMLAAILTLCGATSAMAQIDPQVTEIMRKCEEVMSNPAGVEMTMTVEARMVIKLTGMTATVAEKNGKSMTMTVTKIKFGVSDDVFKFDPKNYPNAIIVRK
ncbi:MAG: hypothetical protein F082_1651 [bacterium F082]|nr:MAG: hypothetical protein F082_1651 [bacterium F082]